MLTFTLRKQLRDFTTEVTEQLGNETLVLIGHSGDGKSTLLKMAAGLLNPDDGEVKIHDQVLYSKKQNINLPPEERNIGFVFQNYALFPHLTVRENVAYGLKNLSREEQEERVDETLAFLGIEPLEDAKPPMLSGGEQQRVALARALVTKPDVLLLDEPLSALDVSTRSRVRMELKELLSKLSIPTIIVTHDFEDARVLADKVAVMDQGKIIQSGEKDEIARFPASRFVAQFTGTNLLPVENETGKITHVAFDPWKVEVSSQAINKDYQWQGKVRDINHNGGFVRLQIELAADRIPFHADIPIESFNQKGIAINQTIYAGIDAQNARPIELSPQAERNSKEKPPLTQRYPKKKKRTRKWVALVLALFLISVTATVYAFQQDQGTTEEKTKMLALVAANATEPFKDLMAEFEKNHPRVDVEATFAGTQVVRTQLEQGANADLFLAADLNHMEAVQKQGLVEEFSPVSNNSVTIVVPKENPLEINSLSDLGTGQVKLVIGTDTVPVGRYARQVFENAKKEYGEDFPERVMDNVVSLETNVKQVLQKVSLGEAEAGIVYPTDVTPDFAKNVKKVQIPEKFNITATNYISVPKKAPNGKAAEEFMEMMLSDKGQAIFKKYGYQPVE